MAPKKEPGNIRAKDMEDSSGPTTTVFVGNISEKASDMLVRQLLAVSLSYMSRTEIWTTYQILETVKQVAHYERKPLLEVEK